MMGTRRTMSSSRQSWISSSDSSLTRFGWSHRFMSVPTTICMFTVFCVCLNTPAPASMSCTIRHEGWPAFFISSAALRYRLLTKRPGSPAHSSSSSPADITTGVTPIALQLSSRLNVLPLPLPPQMPRIKGTFVVPSAPLFSWPETVPLTPGLDASLRKFFAKCSATRS